jgi:transcriptional regulator with XRE-family HTH domain
MQLLRWIEKTGRTLTGFAHESGFHVSTVYRWAHGERVPSAEALVEIERISNSAVTAKDFVNGRRRR